MPLYSRPPRSDELWHHGVKGQKWGIKNGPPYPLDKSNPKQVVRNIKFYADRVRKDGAVTYILK